MPEIKIYDKLVRDRIPEIIEKSGRKACYWELGDEAFELELRRKLVEEANELLNAKTKDEFYEELADVMQVLDSFLDMIEGTEADRVVDTIYLDKRSEKGAFDKHIYLHSVEGG